MLFGPWHCKHRAQQCTAAGLRCGPASIPNQYQTEILIQFCYIQPENSTPTFRSLTCRPDKHRRARSAGTNRVSLKTETAKAGPTQIVLCRMSKQPARVWQLHLVSPKEFYSERK